MNKLIITVIITAVSMIMFQNTLSFGQIDNEKPDLQKLIDYNKRVNDDVLEKFAQERELNFIPSSQNSSGVTNINNKNVNTIDFDNQKMIGEALIKEFLKTNQLLLNDPMLLKYVISVGKLVANSINNNTTKDYVFGILNDPAVRIYVFPGGYIFVTRGYLKVLKNEGELAGSIAREVAEFDKDLYMGTLTSSEETSSLIYTLINLNQKESDSSNFGKNKMKADDAKKPYSDPFASLDYYGSPYYDKDSMNKSVTISKLLRKVISVIPNYEIIIEKDKSAVYSIHKLGYDAECVKDMILELNKENQQAQVVNRTINIENWINQKEFAKSKKNKVEGRYVMMIERLNY